MLVLLFFGPLAASHAAALWVTVSMATGQMDRRTDARPLHYAFGRRDQRSKLTEGDSA